MLMLDMCMNIFTIRTLESGSMSMFTAYATKKSINAALNSEVKRSKHQQWTTVKVA